MRFLKCVHKELYMKIIDKFKNYFIQADEGKLFLFFFLIPYHTKLEKAISKGFIIAKCQNTFFFTEKNAIKRKDTQLRGSFELKDKIFN